MRMLDIYEMAEKLSVGRRTIQRWIAAGKLPPSVRIGREHRWSEDAVDRWIAAGCPRQRGAKPARR